MDTIIQDIYEYQSSCEYPTCGEPTPEGELTESIQVFHGYNQSPTCIKPMLCDTCYEMNIAEVGDAYCYSCHPHRACAICATMDGYPNTSAMCYDD